MSNYKKHLTDWIFHWNSYTDMWEAVKREYYTELFSGNKGNVIKAGRIQDLIEVINKKIYKKVV